MKLHKVFLLAMLIAAPQLSATVISYYANLNGASESPPVASPGTGLALVTIDGAAHTMRVQVSFADLVAPNTASHIHCCTATAFAGTAGVATVTPTFTGFPSGVTAGTYDHTFDLTLATSWNGAFITANGGTTAGAESALLAGLAVNKAYLNIHSSFAPGGEIRGFLVQTPEPATLGLVGLALAGLWGFRRRISA